jgi:hypothetical protein
MLLGEALPQGAVPHHRASRQLSHDAWLQQREKTIEIIHYTQIIVDAIIGSCAGSLSQFRDFLCNPTCLVMLVSRTCRLVLLDHVSCINGYLQDNVLR